MTTISHNQELGNNQHCLKLKYMNTNAVTQVTIRDLEIKFGAQTFHVTWTCHVT